MYCLCVSQCICMGVTPWPLAICFGQEDGGGGNWVWMVHDVQHGTVITSTRDDGRALVTPDRLENWYRDPVRFLSFSREQSRVVTGLLTRHNTLRRHLHLMGLTDRPLCRQCGAEDETSVHILSVWGFRLYQTRASKLLHFWARGHQQSNPGGHLAL
jgi:hypothetical protein